MLHRVLFRVGMNSTLQWCRALRFLHVRVAGYLLVEQR